MVLYRPMCYASLIPTPFRCDTQVVSFSVYHSPVAFISLTLNFCNPLFPFLSLSLFTYQCPIMYVLAQCDSRLTYSLTPWCRVLPEKLTGLQLVKKFPAFHGTRRFITALISVRHLSLSWASPIQSTYPHPTSGRSILILSTHLRLGLPSGLLPSGFPTKTLYTPSPHPCAPHAQPISFLSILSPAQYSCLNFRLLSVSSRVTLLT